MQTQGITGDNITDEGQNIEALSLALASHLDLSHVHQLKTTCDQLLASSGHVHIDASQVARVDTAALQLLYMMIKQLEQHDRKVFWLLPSDAFQQAVNGLAMANVMANVTELSGEAS